MNAEQIAIAHDCHEGAETDRMTFPQSVAKLMQKRASTVILSICAARRERFICLTAKVSIFQQQRRCKMSRRVLMSESIKAAIREAQALVPGYTYHGFCAKVAAAGCAGYLVSFPGRRVLYFGRTGETHVEYFPGAQS